MKRYTAGGIIVPDTVTEKPIQWEVVAVVNGRINQVMNAVRLDAKPEDQILFGKYASTEIKLEGEELFVMRKVDIMVILDE